MNHKQPDPSLFRAQRAEAEVRDLREQLTALKVLVLQLHNDLEFTRRQQREERELFAEDLRLARELLSRVGAVHE